MAPWFAEAARDSFVESDRVCPDEEVRSRE